jgi:hypothetical protein
MSSPIITNYIGEHNGSKLASDIKKENKNLQEIL